MTLAVVESLDSLESNEQIIARGLRSFVEVGQALARIREGRLYKGGFDTFEEYCQERWQLNRAHADRLVRTSDISIQLDRLGAHTPATESQARELSGLEPGEAQEVMEAAYGNTDGKLTAAAIKAARHEYEGRPEQPPETDAHDNAEKDLALINDIRLYLRHIGQAKEVARLSTEAKQHIITALQNTITDIEGTI